MANTTDEKTVPDVAIVGGGIAGLCLAICLIKNKVPVTVYEAAHHFGEIGAGVYFQPNAIRAMEGIDPKVKAGFERVATHNAFPELQNVWFDLNYGEGEKAGEQFYSLKCPGPHAGVHRARFLEEMIKLVPAEVAKFGKRVTEIRQDGDQVHLQFKDGSEATHSCVVGSDGIHSAARKFVLGSQYPAAAPVFSGKYCHRGLMPMEKAVEILGEEKARNSQFYLGHGCHLLTFPVEFGKTFNAVAISSCDTWDSEKWVVPGDFKDINEDFKSFNGPAKKIIKEMEDSDIWALFDDPPASTFARENVAIIGDAAHATTPHQGSGAGVAVEDAYVLGSMLAQAKKPEQIAACFKAFDAVRRQRGHDLVTTSREAGWIWDQEHPDIGDDIEKMKENVSKRLEWIWNVDLEGEIQDGIRLMLA